MGFPQEEWVRSRLLGPPSKRVDSGIKRDLPTKLLATTGDNREKTYCTQRTFKLGSQVTGRFVGALCRGTAKADSMKSGAANLFPHNR